MRSITASGYHRGLLGSVSLASATLLLAACASATSATTPTTAATQVPTVSPSRTAAPTVAPTASSTPTSPPMPTASPTASPEDLTISPATLGQLRELWTLDEPGNPRAQSGCQDVACWRPSRLGGFAVSPDDQTIAVGVCLVDPTENTTNPRHYRFKCDGPSEVRLYDSATGEVKQTLPVRDYPLSLAYSPDGATLAVGMAERSIELWDLAASKRVQTLLHSTTRTGVDELAFTPDGKTLISSGDSKLQVWEVARGIPQGTIENVSDFSLDPAGGGLATLFWSSDGSYAEARTYPFGDLGGFRGFRVDWNRSPYAVAYTQDGSRLIVFGYDSVELLDPSSGDITGKADLSDLLAEGQQGFVAQTGEFMPDGRLMLAVNLQVDDSFSSGLGSWTPLDTGMDVGWLPAEWIGGDLVMSPQGRYLVSQDMTGLISVWGVDPTAPAVEPTCVGTCSS